MSTDVETKLRDHDITKIEIYFGWYENPSFKSVKISKQDGSGLEFFYSSIEDRPAFLVLEDMINHVLV